MKAGDYFERFMGWYEHSPGWVQLVWAPVAIPIMFAYAVVVMAVMFGVVIPVLTVWMVWADHRLWRRLRREGRVGRWEDVAPRAIDGTGTLVVEVGPKGPGCAWLIDRPRAAIDPEATVPTWDAYEVAGLDVLDRPPGWERVKAWAAERLRPFESTAPVLVPSMSQIDALPPEAKRGAVLVVDGWERGFAERAPRPAPISGRPASGSRGG